MTPEELKLFEEKLPEEFFMHDNCECWNESGEPRCYQRERIKVKDFINNLLKSRQDKMIEAIKEMSLCYADDSIENEMDYITGQAHFKQHIIDMFNQGLDKGIEIIKNI